MDAPAWVVFDATGTLIEPFPSVAAVYERFGAEFGSRLTQAELLPRFKVALSTAFHRPLAPSAGPPTDEISERQRWKRIVQLTLDDLSGEDCDLVFEKLWLHFAEPGNWQLFDEVKDCLTILRERQCRIAVASNFDGRLFPILDGLLGAEAFDKVMTSSQLGWSKPDPRFFIEAARCLGEPQQGLWMIGDDELNDVQAARAAGWRASLVDRRAGIDLKSVLS